MYTVSEVSPDGVWAWVVELNAWKTKDEARALGCAIPGEAPPPPPAPVMPTPPPMPGAPGGISTPPGFTNVAPAMPGMPGAAPLVPQTTAMPAPAAMPGAQMPVMGAAPMPGSPTAMPSAQMPSAAAPGGARTLADYADLSGIQENSFRLLDPEKEYEGRIVSSKVAPNGTDGTLTITLELVTTWPEEARGVTIYDSIGLKDKGMGRWKMLCRAGEHLDANERYNGDVQGQCFVDDIVAFTVVTGARQDGSPKNKVKWEYRAGTRSRELGGAGAAAPVPSAGVMGYGIPPVAPAPIAPVAPIAPPQPQVQYTTDPATSITYAVDPQGNRTVAYYTDPGGAQFVLSPDGQSWVPKQ